MPRAVKSKSFDILIQIPWRSAMKRRLEQLASRQRGNLKPTTFARILIEEGMERAEEELARQKSAERAQEPANAG